MAVQYTRIELWEVLPVLQKRGYLVHGQRIFGIQLTKADKTQRFKDTGKFKRQLLGGVTKRQLEDIMRFSRDPAHAADQIEAISLGKTMEVEKPMMGSGPQLDQEQIDRIAQSRAEHIASEMTRELQREKEQLAKSFEERIAKMEKALAAAEPAGKKKGKKTPRVLKDVGEPDLTEEQEREYQRVMSNLGPAVVPQNS